MATLVSNRVMKICTRFTLDFPPAKFQNGGDFWGIPYFVLYRKVIRDEGGCLCSGVHS
jgi:hypothetical protein